MNFLRDIPVEIWGTLIASLTTFYCYPFFGNTRKRELLTYKLLNVYGPIKKAGERLLYSDDQSENKQIIENALKTILSVVDKHYSYCPGVLLHHTYNLNKYEPFTKEWKNSYNAIIELAFYEEFYCQSKLKLNSIHMYDFRDYSGFSLWFKIFLKKIEPFLTFIVFANIGIAVTNMFVVIFPVWTPLIVSLITSSIYAIDVLITKKTIDKKIKKQQNTTSNSNYS